MSYNAPSMPALALHMKHYGPVGILESATHLSPTDYAELERQASRMKYDKVAKKWTGG